MTRIPQPARDAPASEWNVYADALQEAGDPRGELIALANRPDERDAHVQRHRDALFGKAAAHAGALRVAWHYCLPDEVTLRIGPDDPATDIASAFLDSPLAAAPTLRLVGAGKVSLARVVAMLAAELPAATRVLRFIDERAAATHMLSSRDFDPGDNLVDFGDLAPFWRRDQLEEITFDVADTHQLKLGEIVAPQLQRFALRGLRFAQMYDTAPIVTTLDAAKLPGLRSCEVRLVEEWAANIIDDRDAYDPSYYGNEDFEDRMDEADEGERYEDANWAQLRPFLEMLKSAPLERLALTSFDSTQSLLDTLAAVGLPPTLHTLDLSDSGLASVDWFLANKAMFFTVKRLVLERTAIDAESAKRLADLGPEIVHSTDAGAPTYRYTVGSE